MPHCRRSALSFPLHVIRVAAFISTRQSQLVVPDRGTLHAAAVPLRALHVDAARAERSRKHVGHLQAAVTPVIGSAGAVYNRVYLTAAGTVIWGATSAGTALASSLAKVRWRSLRMCRCGRC